MQWSMRCRITNIIASISKPVPKSFCMMSFDIESQWNPGNDGHWERLSCRLGPLLPTEISWTSIEIRAWVSNYNLRKRWGVITPLCPNFNGDLVVGFPMDFPDKGQWCRALKFSLICAWTNGWANNWDASDLICHRAHYDVTVMKIKNRRCRSN